MAIGQYIGSREINGSKEYEYFFAELQDRTPEGFENLVREMENDGWKLVVKPRRGFTLVNTREERIELSLSWGTVPFERLKK